MATLDERISAFGTSLSTARKNIISAIVAKGVSCANTVKLSALPSYIAKITNKLNVTHLGQYAGSGTQNVVGTSTSSPYEIPYNGKVVIAGGWDGTHTENAVTVYINGSQSWTYDASQNTKFSKTINVTKGQKLYIKGTTHTSGTYGLTQDGGWGVSLVYLT